MVQVKFGNRMVIGIQVSLHMTLFMGKVPNFLATRIKELRRGILIKENLND